MVTHSTAGDGGNRRASVFERLYIGNGAFDIVGKRMRWYVSLGLLVLVCIGAMGIKGFNLGIDFEGGTKLQVPAVGAQGPISEDQVQEAFTEALGHPAETVQLVGTASSQTIQVRTESLNTAQVTEVKETMFQRLQPLGSDGRPSPAAVSYTHLTLPTNREV